MKIIFLTVFFCVCVTMRLCGDINPDVAVMVREADKVIVYSLEPEEIISITDWHGNQTDEEKKTERLHGYKVLGKITEPDEKTSAAIRSAFIEAITSDFAGPSYQCFLPRHGLCLIKGDVHVDLLICFECHVGYAYYSNDTGQKKIFIRIGPSGQTALNELFDARGVARNIPPKAEPNISQP